MIPCVHTERLPDALVEAGVNVDVVLYADADHMWMGNPRAARKALDHTVRYLGALLGVTH